MKGCSQLFLIIDVKANMLKLVIGLLVIPAFSFSQIGGMNAFPFLDLGYNARANALGGTFISVKDRDINLGVTNPSLLNKEMGGSIGFNQALLAGGINYGMVTYGRSFSDQGTGSVHLRYVAYGEMERTDILGNTIGTFSAGDFILGAGYGHQLNPNISVGANFNLIWSQLESFSSLGFSIDLAGTYQHENKRTSVTAMVRNFGYQLTTYTDDTRTPLPAQAMMAFSHKLEHAPFRFSVLAHHLNKWDITYNDPTLQPTIDPLSGELIPVPTAGFAEKFFHHLVFQLEILAGETMHIRMAFDYHRRRSMLVPNRPGMGGFSFGTGFNFKRFSIDYGLLIFSSAGFNNMLTLTTNLDKWKK
jgi:hypothetical protein